MTCNPCVCQNGYKDFQKRGRPGTHADSASARLRGERLDFLVPLTSKIAFGFEILGFEIVGSYSQASYLRRCGVLYRPYGRNCPEFQTQRLFSK